MDSPRRLAKLPPLFFGRVTRVLFGVASLAALTVLGVSTLGWTGATILAFLGLSFLVGGLMANPGCEVTALLNVLLPPARRMHFP